MKRRTFLKVLGGLGALTFTGLNIGCTKADEDVPSGFPEVSGFGGLKPEAIINLDNGDVQVESSVVMRHSACLGCYSSCGNRVKVDKTTGKIVKVYGNPYNPNNAEPHLAMDQPLTDGYLAFSTYEDRVNTNRGTLCARGNGTLEAHYDPMRITAPLKRSAGRGEGSWKPISWDELIEETVEGGKLFEDIGEDYNIEGLRQVRDFETLIDSKRPDLGPVANQFVVNGGRGDGRGALRPDLLEPMEQ